MPGVRTNNAHDAFAPHDLALLAAFSDRCLNFHNLPEPVGDSASGKVVRRQLYQHSVPREDSDEVHPDLAGSVGEHPVPVSQFYTKHGVGQILFHRTFYFYRFLLSHQQPSLITSMRRASPKKCILR
jgi:hypothetical protein